MNPQSQPSIRIGILAVGTELTTGQVLNSNAQWIARRLHRHGILSHIHVTVPDDREQILSSLQSLARQCTHLIVTGGLGPTSDDFTRDLIAQWMGLSLIFDESSWQHVEERLKMRGVPVRDIQRQQCLFPQGATILKNPMGTANAFEVRNQTHCAWVLPGPPKEVQSIWNEHLEEKILQLAKKLDPIRTESWDTLGFGESEIAHRVEEVTDDCPFDKGFRVHLPYVEAKLSFPESRAQEAKFWIQRIEQTLKPMTISRNGADVAQLLVTKMAEFKNILLIDEVSGGILHQRLQPYWGQVQLDQRSNKPTVSILGSFEIFRSLTEMNQRKFDCVAGLTGRADAGIRVSLLVNQQMRSIFIPSPQRFHLHADRKSQYFTEMALIFWQQQLLAKSE